MSAVLHMLEVAVVVGWAEKEDDWAAKQRNDREGGARDINLSPAAASKKKKTGRKNNNNSWFGISSSSGCFVCRY